MISNNLEKNKKCHTHLKIKWHISKVYKYFFSRGLNTFGAIIFLLSTYQLLQQKTTNVGFAHVSQTITLDLCWKQNGVNSNSSYPIPHAMGWSLMMCLVQAKRSPNSHCSCQDYKHRWLMATEEYFTDNSVALSPKLIEKHSVLIKILMITLNNNFQHDDTNQLKSINLGTDWLCFK